MNLSSQEINDFNTITSWLAENDILDHSKLDAELAILAGHAVLPNIEGAFAWLAKTDIPLLLSGGVGHSTVLLKKALASTPDYADLSAAADSEAGLLAALSAKGFDIDPQRLIIEDQSRNCGENAAFSLCKLKELPEQPQRIILIQDPLMQRRTTATFRYEWTKRGLQAEFISWPVFVPRLILEDGKPVIAGAQTGNGLWELDRYMSMTLGEVRRLRDDPQGYGPRGMGFIDHIDIPPAVERAWHNLMNAPSLSACAR